MLRSDSIRRSFLENSPHISVFNDEYDYNTTLGCSPSLFWKIRVLVSWKIKILGCIFCNMKFSGNSLCQWTLPFFQKEHNMLSSLSQWSVSPRPLNFRNERYICLMKGRLGFSVKLGVNFNQIIFFTILIKLYLENLW